MDGCGKRKLYSLENKIYPLSSLESEMERLFGYPVWYEDKVKMCLNSEEPEMRAQCESRFSIVFNNNCITYGCVRGSYRIMFYNFIVKIQLDAYELNKEQLLNPFLGIINSQHKWVLFDSISLCSFFQV